MNPTISIIAAISENRVIGKDNLIPWHIKEDLIRFKNLTTGHAVIMGRKTFESIGHPLPNRLNIIITRSSQHRVLDSFEHRDLLITHSIEEAIETARRKKPNQDIFIAGGANIFAQTIDKADKLYLTIVKGEFTGDAYFPDYSRFKKIIHSEDKFDGKYHFTFLNLTLN